MIVHIGRELRITKEEFFWKGDLKMTDCVFLYSVIL